MTTPEPQTPVTPHPLASWGTRAVGFLIDWLPVIILSVLTAFSSALRNLLGVLSVLYVAYLGHMEGVTGQTPGKAVMGIRLVDKDGQLLGSGTGIGRKFAHIVDGLVCGLGYLLPIVDQNRQTIADKLLDTYVVEGMERKSFAVELWSPPSTT